MCWSHKNTTGHDLVCLDEPPMTKWPGMRRCWIFCMHLSLCWSHLSQHTLVNTSPRLNVTSWLYDQHHTAHLQEIHKWTVLNKTHASRVLCCRHLPGKLGQVSLCEEWTCAWIWWNNSKTAAYYSQTYKVKTQCRSYKVFLSTCLWETGKYPAKKSLLPLCLRVCSYTWMPCITTSIFSKDETAFKKHRQLAWF